MVTCLMWLFCEFCAPGGGRESVMDLMKDEQPRAVTGSRSLSEFWFKSFLPQLGLQTRTGYSGVRRELSCWLSGTGNAVL